MAKNPFRCSKKKLRMNRNPKKRLGSSHDPSLHLFFPPKMAMTCFEVCRSTEVQNPPKKRETARVSGAFRLATCPPLKFLEALKWRCPKTMEVDDKQKRVLKLLKGQIWL